MGRKTHKQKVAERRRLRNYRAPDPLRWTDEDAAETVFPGEQALPESLKEVSNEIKKITWFKAAYANGKFESANEAANAVVQSANLYSIGEEWYKLERVPLDCIAHDIEFDLAYSSSRWNSDNCRSLAERLLIPVEEPSTWLTNTHYQSESVQLGFRVSRHTFDRAYVAVGKQCVYLFCFFGED